MKTTKICFSQLGNKKQLKMYSKNVQANAMQNRLLVFLNYLALDLKKYITLT